MAKMALVGLFESFESPMRSVLTPLYYFQLNFVYEILPGTIWKHSSFPNVCHPFSLPPPTSPNRSCVTGSLLLSVRYPSSALRVWSFLSQLHLRLSGHVPGYKRYSHTPLCLYYLIQYHKKTLILKQRFVYALHTLPLPIEC